MAQYTRDQLKEAFEKVQNKNHFHKVFVHVDGKKFEVTAIVNSMKDANDICAADKTVGVIDETSNGMIIIAKLDLTA